MAQVDFTPSHHGGEGRLSVRRCAFTGAVLAAILFVVHWLGVALHVGAMPMYGWMFASGMMSGGLLIGLIVGLSCALLGGLVVGALAAMIYNAFEFTVRR
jgi:hypothetical protein